MKSLAETAAIALFLLAATMVAVHCIGGCSPALPRPQYPDYCSDEARYEAEEVACVERSHTLRESRDCRRKLDAKCGW